MKTAIDISHALLTCKGGVLWEGQPILHVSFCDAIVRAIVARDAEHAAELAKAREEAGEWAARAARARDEALAEAEQVARQRADSLANWMATLPLRSHGRTDKSIRAGECYTVADAIAALRSKPA